MKKLRFWAVALMVSGLMACTGNKGVNLLAGGADGDSTAVDTAVAASDTLVFETVEVKDSMEYDVKIMDYSSDEEPTPYTMGHAVDRYEVKTLKAVAGNPRAVEFINQWLVLDVAGDSAFEVHTAAEVEKAYAQLKAEKGVADVRAAGKLWKKNGGYYSTEDWDEIVEMPFLSANEYTASVTVMWQTENLLTLGMSGYDYWAGAAHGAPWDFTVTFDLKNLRILQLDDVFVKAGRKALLKRVIAQLKEDYRGGWDMANPDSDIDFPNASPSLTPEGVQFCYGAYEIGAYALGLPVVTLPYAELQDYLTPEVKELIE